MTRTAREIFLDANKRAGEAAFLREVGWTYQQIGDRMGVSRSRAKTLSDKGAKIRAKRTLVNGGESQNG